MSSENTHVFAYVPLGRLQKLEKEDEKKKNILEICRQNRASAKAIRGKTRLVEKKTSAVQVLLFLKILTQPKNARVEKNHGAEKNEQFKRPLVRGKKTQSKLDEVLLREPNPSKKTTKNPG